MVCCLARCRGLITSVTAFFFSVPTLRFALNPNWKENVTVDGVVLKKQFRMSWLLSRSQWHVNRSAFASAAVVSGCGGRVAVYFAFWNHRFASRLSPVSPQPFLSPLQLSSRSFSWNNLPKMLA